MTRGRTLADVVDLAAVEPDGLLVTTGGRYVRLLECGTVLQLQAGGAPHRELLRERLGALAGRLPAGQALQVVVEAEPIDADVALASDWREIGDAAGATEAHRDSQLAGAMTRLGYGLEQTVRRTSAALDGTSLRWTVATVWSPPSADTSSTESFRRLVKPVARSRVRVIARTEHERAAGDSWRFSETIAGDLTAAGCAVRSLDGPDALAALARGVRPATAIDPYAFSSLPRVLDTHEPGPALAHRDELLRAISGGAELRPARDLMLRQASGEPYAAEAILHLAATPAETSLWWLMALMQVPPPWRLAVHLTATDRAGQRRRFRWRHRRLWADLRRRERDGKLIPEEAYEEEREAAEIAAELRSAGASGIYDVSVYLAIRRDAGEQVELAELAAALSKDFERYSDARLYGGRFLVEDSWVSTLPLGVDRLGATRRFAQRNVGDCIPLLSTSASSPGGVPLGLAVPGSTLERVDLFDEEYRTHVALVTGASGSGKTVAVNALLARNLARGATGYIIDRSSSEDEGGSTRQAGHYEPLTDLIPGARITHFGAEQRDAILNPWDVADTARISAGKIEFLVALHTLLVGDVVGGTPTFGGLERTQLARGIQAVYARCTQTGESPREALLQQELRRLAREQAADSLDGDASVVSELRRLAERLHPYVGDGPVAWLADRPTTIARSAPLNLFDLAGLPDALAAPVILTLVDFIDREVQQRRAHRLAHPSDASGPWAGRAFVAIDEAWKPLMTPAAGAWLNEWARRTRHIACALLVITQHLADFNNPQGRALLRNSVLRLLFHTSHDELAEVRDTLGLHAEDIEAIARLETRKGDHSTCYLDSEVHGRTTVRIDLGDVEYWTCSADPERDQPIRRLAYEDAQGDPWRALRLLVDPDWHQRRADQLAEAST